MSGPAATVAPNVAAQAQSIDPNAAAAKELDRAFDMIHTLGDQLDTVINNFSITSTYATIYLPIVIGLIAVIGIALLGKQGNKIKDDLDTSLAANKEQLTGGLAALKDELQTSLNANKEIRETNERSVREQMQRLETRVDSTLSGFDDTLDTKIELLATKKGGESQQRFSEMTGHIADLKSKITDYEELLGLMQGQAEEKTPTDPYEIYTELRSLDDALQSDDHKPEEDRTYNEESRAQARAGAIKKLEKFLAHALKGKVDANLLFNTAMVATRLELEHWSVQLFTLAQKIAPTTSHKLAMYRLTLSLRTKYDVEDLKVPGEDGTIWRLNRAEMTPDAIAAEAFGSALKAAAKAPLPQNEIIYAELWNMAQNLREDGGYERMRDVLMASYKARKGEEVTEGDFHDTRDREMFTGPDADGTWDQKDVPIPSNLPGKISAVYALIGTGNWREKYDTYLRHAVELAANESDLTTWRKSFLRDAQDTANKLGLGAEFKALLEREGVEYQSTQERQMQHILELLQQRQMEDGDAQAASDDVIG